ncbi:MAG: peptidoglycan bridge formation glycyltransferase FemA/FemB family protein [Verrucomicrobiae bacterium]|nr:peptidoglycan bridge formation glycyltransferase FemA/FemB family protein [Verrucomicrobiae bacterium]
MATEKFTPDAARRLNPLENPNWDALLTSRPDFSFFHGAAWARVLVETYGYVPHYFYSGDVAAPEIVLPLMEVDSWLTGRRGVALPFTDECAPLGAGPESFGGIFAEAVAFGKSRGWKYLELRGGGEFLEGPASISFYGHGLDLSADERAMFERMDGSARRAVRKAEGKGVTVEISRSLEAVRDFYRLQCLTRKRHGLPPQPWAFFVNIHRLIVSQNLGMVAVAGHAGKKIAASVYFFMGGRAIYKYGASDFAQQHLRGPNLVMWEAMKWLARQGATRLNLGKTSLTNEGLRRFKLNLGAHEERVGYVKFDLRRGRFVTEKDGVAGWHNAVFRALPGFASRAAGSLLYRHWA